MSAFAVGFTHGPLVKALILVLCAAGAPCGPEQPPAGGVWHAHGVPPPHHPAAGHTAAARAHPHQEHHQHRRQWRAGLRTGELKGGERTSVVQFHLQKGFCKQCLAERLRACVFASGEPDSVN